MERPCRNTSARSLALISEYASVKDSSGSLVFACASPGRKSRAWTRSGRRPLKKLRVLAKEPEIDLWAMDEVHFQQYGSRCRMWVPPETRDPVLLHHPTRRGVGYFGAVR